VRETQEGSAALLLTGSGKGIRETSNEPPIVGSELEVVAMAFATSSSLQMESRPSDRSVQTGFLPEAAAIQWVNLDSRLAQWLVEK